MMSQHLDDCINEVFDAPAQNSLFEYNGLVEKTIRHHWKKGMAGLQDQNEKLETELKDLKEQMSKFVPFGLTDDSEAQNDEGD